MFMGIETGDITIFGRKRFFRWMLQNFFVWSFNTNKTSWLLSRSCHLWTIFRSTNIILMFLPALRHDKSFGATTSILYLYITEVLKTSVSRLIFSNSYCIAVFNVFNLNSTDLDYIFKLWILTWTILFTLLLDT